MNKWQSLYRDRKLAAGYPDMETRGVAYQSHAQDTTQPGNLLIGAFMSCLERLIDVDGGKVLLVGCGPRPYALKWLLDHGYDAEGVEPVPMSVRSAQELGPVHLGSAECIPFPDASRRVVLMESVLEHVDSPEKTLAEAYRVLSPGGVLFVLTTNRWKLKVAGFNWEYPTIRYFNWFPKVVQESYVFQALHYRPELANYNTRPAVHWFSHAELCRLGRAAGFGQFYSSLDLADLDNPLVKVSKARRFLLNKVRYNPWLRALALTQMGQTSIFMLKRRS